MIYGHLIGLNQFQMFFENFCDYLDKYVYAANEAMLIRDLCIKQDSGDFSFLNIDELRVKCLFYCVQHEQRLAVFILCK